MRLFYSVLMVLASMLREAVLMDQEMENQLNLTLNNKSAILTSTDSPTLTTHSLPKFATSAFKSPSFCTMDGLFCVPGNYSKYAQHFSLLLLGLGPWGLNNKSKKKGLRDIWQHFANFEATTCIQSIILPSFCAWKNWKKHPKQLIFMMMDPFDYGLLQSLILRHGSLFHAQQRDIISELVAWQPWAWKLSYFSLHSLFL